MHAPPETAEVQALRLRDAGVPDLPDMLCVMGEAFDAAYGEAWNAAQCVGILGLPGVWLTLASLNAVPAGFALGRIVLDEAELLLIGVRPAWCRRGVGNALLTHTLSRAAQSGARRLHLEMRSGNAAIAMYQRAGFVQVGRRPAYYRGMNGAVFDALSLAVSLPGCARG